MVKREPFHEGLQDVSETPLPSILETLEAINTFLADNQTSSVHYMEYAQIVGTAEGVCDKIQQLGVPQHEEFQFCMKKLAENMIRMKENLHEIAAIRRKLSVVEKAAFETTHGNICRRIDELNFLADLVDRNEEISFETVLEAEAEKQFWKQYFGSACVVTVEQLLEALEKNSGGNLSLVSLKICALVDVMNDGQITLFCLRRFLEWFGPFEKCVENAKAICKSWFHPLMTQDDAEQHLVGKGGIVLRLSYGNKFSLAFTKTIKESNGPWVIQHGLINHDKNGWSASTNPQNFLESLPSLIGFLCPLINYEGIKVEDALNSLSTFPSAPPDANEKWYFGSMSRVEAEHCLQRCHKDAILVRESSLQNAYALSFYFHDKKEFVHVPISMVDIQGYIGWECDNVIFHSILDILRSAKCNSFVWTGTMIANTYWPVSITTRISQAPTPFAYNYHSLENLPPPPPPTLDSCITEMYEHRGWLDKIGGVRKNKWQRRYVVLDVDRLSYYQHKEDEKPRGVIPAKHIFEVVTIPYETYKRDFCFAVKCHEKVIAFAASTESEMQLWMEVLINGLRR